MMGMKRNGKNETNERTGGMSKHEARITPNNGGFYAVIVRIDKYDGQEYVIRGYNGRQFATRKAAERSTALYLAKQ